MKMITVLRSFVLWAVCTHGLRFLNDDSAEPAPAKKEAAKPAAKTEPAAKDAAEGKPAAKTEPAAKEKEAPPPLKGPAHKDNLQDELVDQADPEFDMVSGGDDCISWEDLKKPLIEQFQHDSPDNEHITEEEKEDIAKIEGQMIDDLSMQFSHADTNRDKCIDKAEFKAAGELEGPPPGFQKTKTKMIGKKEFTEQQLKEDRHEFDAMDRNGDGKVSKPELYHYADQNMDQADIQMEQVEEMFADTDTNKDGFISFKEFEGAGEEIEGDGNEMEKVKPMKPSNHTEPVSFKIHKARKIVKKSMAIRLRNARTTSNAIHWLYGLA